MSTLLDDLLSSAAYGFSKSLHPMDLEHAAAQMIQNTGATLSSSGASIPIGEEQNHSRRCPADPHITADRLFGVIALRATFAVRVGTGRL